MYSRRMRPMEIMDAWPDTNRHQMIVVVEVPMKGGVMARQEFAVKVRAVKVQLGIRDPRAMPERMIGRVMVIPEIQNQIHGVGYSVPPIRVRERCY